ncbi:MAG TPA: hypothetical protein VMZ74_01495 [Ramlibacter sp.]|nr:hypothetical protein [Ramlibacter sp.]
MTTVVYIYAGTGRYRGGEYQWNSPLPGGKHDFMLFVRQDVDAPLQKVAMALTGRYGFTDVRFIAQGREINVEMLNQPELANFRHNYEDALKDGASMAWYPPK